MKKIVKEIENSLYDSYLLSKIRFFKRSLIYGIKNIIKWFPVIWYDRQWDSYYFHKILRHKLFLMKEFFESNDVVTEDAKETAEYISLIINKIDLVLENDFAVDCYKKLDDEFGNLELSLNDDSTLNISRSGIKTQQQKTLEKEAFMKCIEQEQKEINDSLDYIYGMIRDDVENWWD